MGHGGFPENCVICRGMTLARVLIGVKIGGQILIRVRL